MKENDLNKFKPNVAMRPERVIDRLKYLRVILSTAVAMAGAAGVEAYRAAFHNDRVEIAGASPNFCDTIYETIGEIRAGNPYRNLRSWLVDHFNFAPDAVAVRFNYPNQSLSQKDDATGLWINKIGDPSLPVELQVQIDTANLSQVKAGKDAATLRFGGIWQVDGNMEMFDLVDGSKKLGELKPDTRGNIVVALPENLSRVGFKFNNPHPNSIEVTIGNASNQEITNAVNSGNGFDLRGRPKSITANPCPTSTSTETTTPPSPTTEASKTPTTPPSSTPTTEASKTPTTPPSPTPSKTPEATPAPVEAIPDVPNVLPSGKVNESSSGSWFTPYIFLNGDLRLNNVLEAMRYSGSVLNLRQSDRQGEFWVNTTKESRPIQLDLQFDQNKMQDLLQGQSAVAAFINFPGWKKLLVEVIDESDVRNPRVVGTVRTDDTGFAEVILSDKVSSSRKRLGLRINGITQETGGKISFGPLSSDRLNQYASGAVRNGIDARTLLRDTSFEPATPTPTTPPTPSPTTEATKTPTIPPSPTPSRTPTIPPSPTPSRTPEATPVPLEAIPDVAFILPQGKVNESVRGVWFDPMIFAGMDLKLTNALDGLRFSGAVLNLRQASSQGEVWINTTSEGRPIQMDLQFDQRLLKTLMQNHPAAGVFIDFPGWKNLLVEVIDESKTSNPRIVNSFRLNDAGFGEIVFSDRTDNSKRRFGIRISGIPQETEGRVYFGGVPQGRLDLYRNGQVTDGVDVRSQLVDNPYTRIGNPIMPNGFSVLRPPQIPTPFPTQTPERARDCSIPGPFVDAVMLSEPPLDYFYSIPANTFSRIKLTEDRFWNWGILIAKQNESNDVKYRSSGSGNVIMVTERNVCSTELAVRTDPQYLNQYKNGEDSRVTQHVLIQAPDGTPRKALIQFIQVDDSDKGKLVLEKEVDGYHGFLLSDGSNTQNRIILYRMLLRPFRSDDQNVITVNFGSTSALDLKNPNLQKLQTDLTRFSSLFR